MNWYNEQVTELDAIERDAIRENWRDAYERRKEWEKKIREIFPNWPDLKEILTPILNNASVAIDLTGASCTSQTLAFSAPGTTFTLCIDGTLQLSSTSAGQTSSNTALDFQMSGSLMFQVDPAAEDGNYRAGVYAGSLSGKSPVGISFTLTVEKSSLNVLNVNAQGDGTINLLFTRELSDEGWNAILPYYVRVQLPVHRSANGSVTVAFPSTPVHDLVPFTPDPVSDYDRDGTLNLGSDYSAFLADWFNHNPITDMDVNQVWDQADLDQWLAIFNHDASH